ncbi:Tat pathway signal protein [Cellvibrio zantedeschiae]|uniref:Tat pathway signal protein n=1 Tax=Cellvibrio zantedeschiae TaxID=1237077 RepID=A0ABQ3B4U8_9GAMM|nr:DUF1501 domain-containing protein [Cellvibrio zantedeschiae]GGY77092.1 Tat pathway signal protein [Cellvibrio zantedeschiae]
MHINKINDMTRRAFLKRAGALSIMGAGAPLALNLAGISEAAAFEASDYKALVCVFLFGGNDYANTVVPFDTANYDLYSSIRGGGVNRTAGGIALAHDALTATKLQTLKPQTLTNNIQYALSPELKSMAGLFNSGKAAVQLNIGPLLTPLTLAQYKGSDRVKYPLPPKLFSHNDQQSIWQALNSEGATRGWGGYMGDLALSSNSISTLTCISASGNAVFLAGNNALQYQISPSGAIPIWPAKGSAFNSTAASTALKKLITQSSNHILENELAIVTKRSMELEEVVNAALNPVNLSTSFDRDNKKNSLADQLKVVARLIGARTTLGAKRQVFFVSLGGFDTHDGLTENHPKLLAQVDEAMSAFYQATVELGVADKVTSFTASDFGRTLASNGDGSDHGWGGHHFVVGGAVNGGQFYGTAPQISLTSDDQVGQGRLLPSTSVDQLAATLARWFGVSSTEINSILPNVSRFASSNLGFMR